MTDERRSQLMAELKEIQRKVSIPPMPTLEIGIIRKDQAGNVLEDRSEPGHSWTRNGYNSRLALMGQAGAAVEDPEWEYPMPKWGAMYLTAMDYWYQEIADLTQYCYLRKGQGGGGYLGYAVAPGHGFTNVYQDSYSGLFVGTGTTAFSANHHRLASLIEHGTGSGQLSYAGMAQSARAYDSEHKIWKATHSRNYTNSSGARITIQEVGLVWAGWLFYQYVSYRCNLFARDVLDIPCHVDNTETVTIEYRVMLDYSEID